MSHCLRTGNRSGTAVARGIFHTRPRFPSGCPCAGSETFLSENLFSACATRALSGPGFLTLDAMHVNAPPRRVPGITPGRSQPGDPSALTRVRRVALVAALLALVPVAISYVNALRARSN